MRLFDMNLLVALDALLEEGSVVGAARRMHLSPTAMSRTLSRIREATGDPIMVRAGRALVPTPRALALREPVRALVQQAGQVLNTGAELQLATLERAFNLRANDVFIGPFGATLLDALRQQAPRTVLRFVPEGEGGNDDDALRDGQLDLYISAARDLGPEIKVQGLFSTRFMGLARSDHPLFDAPITAQRLAQYEHISVSRRGRAHGPIDDCLAAMGVQRRVALITPSFHSAMFALVGSDLLLPVPEHMQVGVARLGLPLRAFELPLPGLAPVRVVQAWHPRFDNDPAHRWLRQTVKTLCQQGVRLAQ